MKQLISALIMLAKGGEDSKQSSAIFNGLVERPI